MLMHRSYDAMTMIDTMEINIAHLKETVDNIKEVLAGDIVYQTDVVLSCVVN